MQVKVETVKVGTMDENCYLVVNPETDQLLIVDPGDDPEIIIRAVGERKPAAVLLTHGHFDHIGGMDEVCAHFGIPAYIHELEVEKLTDPVKNESHSMDRDVVASTVPQLVTDGQELELGGVRVTVMHTPGHSKGSCCYMVEKDQCLFTGDTLFLGGYGRTDFWDGNFKDLKQSLRKLLFLEPKVLAYPGHGAPTFAGR